MESLSATSTTTGNQDVFEVMGGVYPNDKFWSALYKNPGHGNHWIKLRLVGVKANRFAVGARIRVDITEDGVQRVDLPGRQQRRKLRRLEPATPYRRRQGRRWSINSKSDGPGSGLVQRFKGPIDVDQIYEITEGKPELEGDRIGEEHCGPPEIGYEPPMNSLIAR